MFRPFAIQRSEDLGRYLTSTQNFDVGDMLWEESPLVSAPSFSSSDIPNENELTFPCVGCYEDLDDASLICTVCRWPSCSDRCSENAVHKKYECKIFARLRTQATPINISKLIFLRVFLLKRVDPQNQEKFQELCFEFSENDAKHQNKCDQEILDIWKFLAQDCLLRVSVDEVARLYCTFRINNFKFSQVQHGAECCGYVVYYYASLMAHSCAQNVEFSFFKSVDANGDMVWNIRLFARKKINAGDVLTIAYGRFELQFGTVQRQMLIHQHRRFICMCSRCQDKTEGGTYFQAMICPKCGKGNLLPMEPIEIVVSPWTCDTCHNMEEATTVRGVVRMLKPVPYSLLHKIPDADSLMMADGFLTKQKYLLHQNHFMMFQCATHWLLGSKFTDDLMSGGKDAKDLFTKILTRAKVYYPLCVEFMACSSICMMLLVIARTYAAFVFKSSDMQQTFVNGDDPLGFKLRICRRILAALKEILEWKKLKAGSYNREMSLFFCWSQHTLKFARIIWRLENSALKSIRFVFSRKFGGKKNNRIVPVIFK